MASVINQRPVHRSGSGFPTAPSREAKLFFGWYLVGIVFLAHFMSVGTSLYAINAFMQPLCELRGWTRTEVNLALVCASMAGFVMQFVYGSLLPRIQIRWLMIVGVVAAGLAFGFLMRVAELWLFYLLYAILFLSNGAYGGIVANSAINNWFQRKRGKALGIATAGVSMAGALIPLLAMLAIRAQGIQVAAIYIAIAITAQAPLIWWGVRDWPEACGLHPDGLPPVEPPASGVAVGPHGGPAHSGSAWTPFALIRTGNFWKLGIAFGLLMSGAVGVMSQLKPRFVDIGFGDLHAMLLLTLTALMATVGKYAWGLLCDYRTPWRVGSVLALGNAAGLGLALVGSRTSAVALFIVIFGFAMGGIMALLPVITASLFGRRAFTQVYRFMSLFLMLQVTGYIIAGQSYDRLGSYDGAYWVFMLFDIAAAVLLWSIRR
jgi:MFS transporter, OFA family, oxalate/formate antiporter